MKGRIRIFVKRLFTLYDMSDLAIGGHCGCCGRWVKDHIVEKDWGVTLCSRCAGSPKEVK